MLIIHFVQIIYPNSLDVSETTLLHFRVEFFPSRVKARRRCKCGPLGRGIHRLLKRIGSTSSSAAIGDETRNCR